MSSVANAGPVGGNRRYRGGVSCPICGGSEDDDRGSGVRCYGYIGSDGLYAHCTREEIAGGLPENPNSHTYAHRLKGPCKCGKEHGSAEPKIAPPKKRSKGRGRIDAVYDYVDEGGELLFQALRYSNPKDFLQRRPGGVDGAFIYSLGDVRRVLYRLPELLASDPSQPVCVVEGEKDVDNLRSVGLVATCNPMGEGKWREDYNTSLRGRSVYIIPDNDEAGRKHSRAVAQSLSGVAGEIKLIDLAEVCRSLGLGELAEKGDASDFLAMGGTADALREAFEAIDPLPCSVDVEKKSLLRVVSPGDAEPPAVGAHEAPSRGRPEFCNFHHEEYTDGEGRKKTRVVAHTQDEIMADLQAISPGWPKAVGEKLFLQTSDYRPQYLDNPARFFAYIDGRAQVAWTKGTRLITQERIYAHLQMKAESYKAIEVMPHTPRRPGVFYMHPELPRSSGKLDRFLDFFCPHTPIDRQLIKAFIATLAWGGPPGQRPAWLITGPDNDPEDRRGRGVGKSKIIDIPSEELFDGFVDVSARDDMAKVKTRLLSKAGIHKRVMRIDNVKTLRLSWDELENLITSPVISGHEMYEGEGHRENTLTVALTANGPNVSKDLAERLNVIKIGRPPRDENGNVNSNWEHDARSFASKHRWEILSELAELLAQPVGPTKAISRWGVWEDAVLSKMPDAAECQRFLRERQGDIDDDNEEADEIREFIRDRISGKGHDPDTSLLIIPSSLMAEWVGEVKKKPLATNTSTSLVNGLGIKELVYNRKGDQRGFMWIGAHNVESEPTRLEKDPFPVRERSDRY